ncbi:MAG: 50S ribosomal protein L6 [Theionarchaea archaeon]|nr:50S ribosomal protein L6 [Theionarchaea archaeon]MBU7001770.1 50S ribosomal protein L6 [Theionarchaea archaeon]MBU7022281.1 50S ribosomal protein L6 [Theionarchaea archaeon]MBU7035515.1 50S ribosomal protein L6 [Theionarchaea archaeon]MBU7041138.1 50S ribosomal protein L6 [Theionarchaea archaeon]
MEEKEVLIPDGVTVELEGKTLTVTGKKGTLTKTFKVPSAVIRIDDGRIVVSTPSSRKCDVAALGTIASHAANMVHGVQEGFEYKLKVFYAHFPMNVTVDGDKVKIDNFLGEKYPRYANIMGDTQVKVQAEAITVTGISKEHVGQTAANLEQATRVRHRDPRVFQDGIYLIERDGVKLK